MRTLLLLFTFVFSSLFSPADTQPRLQHSPSGGERCITAETVETFPWIFEEGRDFVECLTVKDVTATFSQTVPVQVTLHVSGQRWEQMNHYGTEMDVRQWRDGSTLYIAIYRRIAANMNAATPDTYETTLSLDGEFEAGSYAVQINNYALEIAIPNTPPHHDQFQRYTAAVSNVEVMVTESYPIRLSLRVTGYFDAGCLLPLDIQQGREGRRINVDIDCLANQEVRYPDYTPLDEVIHLNGDFERGTYTLQVNDYVTEVQVPYPPPPPPPPLPVRRYAAINNVEVLVHQDGEYPARLTLHVTGTYTEKCQSPLQIEAWHAENRVHVDIYVDLNPAMRCPERLVPLDEYIPLEDSFESGLYTITVNDYTLHIRL